MSRTPHIPALAALVALAIGAGCGGGGEGSASVPAEQQEPAQAQAEARVKAHNEEVKREHQRRKRAEAPTGEEREAKRATADFYAILAEDEAPENKNKALIDYRSFCDLMGEQARQQTIAYAKASSGVAKRWDCESAVELLVIRSKRAGGFEGTRRAEVIGVNAEGGRATATVRFGPKGPATSIPLGREDGEWKLAAAPVPASR